MSVILKQDLEFILSETASLWSSFRSAKIFLSGGTGFIGCWLLESFSFINRHLSLDAQITVLTRDSERFKKKCPHLASDPHIQFCEGDVRNFPFPSGEWTHIIHAATDASAELNANNPALMLDVIIAGTRHMLDFAVQSKAQDFLFLSSGAVYGKQPEHMASVNEEFLGSPNLFDRFNAYGIGKRTAEHLCFLYQQQAKINIKIARCFAFVGPYLPLNIHYAIGNFIQDAMNGNPITIKGDGSPYRSYQYAADMTVWLWTILARGKTAYPYNVGNEKAYSIAEIAQAVSNAQTKPILINIAKKKDPAQPIERYIPSTKRAEMELGLNNHYDLENAIKRTQQWHREPLSEALGTVIS